MAAPVTAAPVDVVPVAMEPTPAPVMESPRSQAVIVTEVRPTTALPMDDEVTCRKPQRLPGSRLLGPAVCLSSGA
jgi:hypothetical protein